ncbi:MAG TPA: hypothetical protein VEI52_20705 [Terriglobales bacterium]|nr:hypothetical protein [Terriglobales bacterium]
MSAIASTPINAEAKNAPTVAGGVGMRRTPEFHTRRLCIWMKPLAAQQELHRPAGR